MVVEGERTTTRRALAPWETTADCWRFLTDQYTARVSRTHRQHLDTDSGGGLDIAVIDGTPVYAAKSGVVNDTFDEWNATNSSTLGNFVRIDHDDGTQGVFLHLQSVAKGLNPGDRVVAGDMIGLSNSTGKKITGPHLHYSQWNESHTKQVDPQAEHPCQ